MLPVRLFGTDSVFKGAQQDLSTRTGQSFAQWPEPWNDDTNFASAVSESGLNLAIADSAKLRIYRVAQ
jgi:hypothetical protein